LKLLGHTNVDKFFKEIEEWDDGESENEEE